MDVAAATIQARRLACNVAECAIPRLCHFEFLNYYLV